MPPSPRHPQGWYMEVWLRVQGGLFARITARGDRSRHTGGASGMLMDPFGVSDSPCSESGREFREDRRQLARLARAQPEFGGVDRSVRAECRTDYRKLLRGQLRAVHHVVAESLMHDRHPAFDDAENRLRVHPYFVLGIGIGPEVQEMQQVPEIHLPVELGVDPDRQVNPREFARNAVAARVYRVSLLVLVQHLQVMVVAAGGVLPQRLDHRAGGFGVGHGAAALAVGG